MKKNRRKFILSGGIVFVLSACVVLFIFKIDYFLDVAGNYLIIDDKPEKCDVVFVPSGNPANRVPKAVEIYRSGMASKIVIAIEKQGREKLEFQKHYGTNFSNRAVVDHVLHVDGIDPAVVTIASKPSVSTKEDFLLLKQVLDTEKANSVIVTSAWYHLRRCQMVARRILGADIRVYFIPVNYPDESFFISRPKRILALINSYLKLVYYYVSYF